MTKYAVIGVSESTGREILSALSEAGISSKNVYALEPRSALGNMVSYGEEDELDILGLDGFDFSKVDVAIFTTVKEVSKKYIPTAVKFCKVIDCSNAYFGDPDVPMIVDGLNDQNLSKAKKGIISVPSADVTQLLLPLKNINEEYGIKRIVVSVYTAASVYGKDGMDELFNQTRKIFMNDTLVDDQKVFKKQIAFNVIPQVGDTDQRITIEGTRGITDGISGDFTGNVVTQTTFGVQATKGDATFGGRYGVNIGGDGRLDHQLKVEFRYAF